MELEPRLRAFAAFARQRSFSAAAVALFISQPAVSKHIADLEHYLGLQLVVRKSRSASLTPAGEFLMQYVLHAEALLAQAERGLAAFHEFSQGTLSLAASGTPATYLLPRILTQFCQLYPGVKLAIQSGTSQQIIAAVRDHQAEIGLVGGFADAPEIQAEHLIEDDVVLIGPAAMGGRRVEPHELRNYIWISREEGSATRAGVEAAWRDLAITPLGRLEMPSWEAVKLLVAQGAGIAACSRLALEVELKAGTLAILDVPRWTVSRTISLIYPAATPLTPPAQQFLQLARQLYVL